MDDPLWVVGGDHHDLKQPYARVNADNQQATLVIPLLLDKPDGIANDVQGIRIGDLMLGVVLASRFDELNNVNDILTTSGVSTLP